MIVIAEKLSVGFYPKMAFVRIIREDHFQADTFRDGESWAIIVNVGYDDQTRVNYSLVVGLSPMVGGPTEYYFHLLETDSETGREHPYWCGRDVAAFVPAKDRAMIRSALLNATKALFDAARPKRVEVVTIDENPPDKALVKHFLVAMTFKECGYAVSTAYEYHGKRVWWMERSD